MFSKILKEILNNLINIFMSKCSFKERELYLYLLGLNFGI